MLFTSAARRRVRESAESLEQLTLAVNNGLAISRDKDARRQFEKARKGRATTEAPGQTVAEYRSTMARLAARFPANVKVH